MHVSLDSALGRQRRLNSVGESVLQIAPNAAAAYSLRSLTGGDPTVVRVRRGSDNHEQDFTASEVSAGALTSFVNAPVIAPLDIQALEADGRTGDFLIAKAAYSLRSLGTRQATLAATGDTVARADGKFVAQVRRSSDDAVKSFTADEITDGTLRNFCLNDDADIISFADAGLAGSPAADKRMYFDGVNDSVSLGSNVVLAGDFEIESKLLLQSYDIVGFSFPCLVGNGSTNRLFFSSGGTTLIFDGTNTAFGGVILPLNTLTTVKLKRTGTTVELFFDGVSKGTTTNSASFTIAFLGSRETTAGLINGFIYDLSITSEGTLIHSYKGYGNASTDWEDQTGSNDGTVAGSPALFTGQGFDGFVKTWYDQSVTNEAGDTATGNHATQATAAEQPKVVSAGALVTGGLDFDGGDSLSVSGEPVITASSSGTYSAFSVQTVGNSESGYLYGNASPSNGSSLYNVGAKFTLTNKSNADLDSIAKSSSQNLLSAVYNNGDAGLLVNGAGTMTDVGTYNFSAGSGDFIIGNRNGGSASSHFLTGSINEIIVYNSNQSANRTAIEANIGEVYSIDLPSGVDPGFDQVDGFVETWYDQSGNSNDAVQTTAGSQPKIVDAGSLVANGIDFDGSDDRLTIPNDLIASINSASSFLVAKSATGSGGRIALALSHSTSNFRFYVGALLSAKLYFGYQNTALKIEVGATDINTDKHLFTAIAGSSNVEAFLDGTSKGTVSSVDGKSTLSSGGIGSINTGNFWSGTIQEVIVYNADQTANRVALETNINSQYSIF